jgi:hypothetical protein
MIRFARPALPRLGASLWLLLAAGPILAGPIQTTVTFEGTGNGQSVSLSYKGGTLNVFAGQFKMHLNNQPGNTAGPQFLSFCVDLDHYIASNYSVYVRSTADGLSHGGVVSYLYQTYGESPLDNVHAAALQLAIWDEVTDGGDGLGSGQFQYSGGGDLANYVASYEAAGIGHTATGFWLDASASGDSKFRGQSVLTPGTPQGIQGQPGDPAVPEPTSIAALGLGCAALAVWRRRRAAA